MKKRGVLWMATLMLGVVAHPAWAQFASSPNSQTEETTTQATATAPAAEATADPNDHDHGFGLNVEPEVGGSNFDQTANLKDDSQAEEESSGPSKWGYNGSLTYATSSSNEPGFLQNVDSLIFSGGASYRFSDTISMSVRGSILDSRQRSLRFDNSSSICTPLEGTDFTIVDIPPESSCQTSDGEVGFLQAFAGSPTREVDRETRFTDAWYGINWDVKREGDWPGVYVSADIALIERTRFNDPDDGETFENFYGRSWSVGTGFFRSIDPVVLSVNFSYSFNFEKKRKETTIQQGRSISVQPSLNFAINNEISINWGVSIGRFGKSKVNGEVQGIVESSIQHQMGMGYAWSDNISFSASASNNVSGEPSASFTLGMSYRP